MKSIEECSCICHNESVILHHCAPCCYQCPSCGKNIVPLFWEEHSAKCKSEA